MPRDLPYQALKLIGSPVRAILKSRNIDDRLASVREKRVIFTIIRCGPRLIRCLLFSRIDFRHPVAVLSRYFCRLHGQRLHGFVVALADSLELVQFHSIHLMECSRRLSANTTVPTREFDQREDIFVA